MGILKTISAIDPKVILMREISKKL